LLFLGFSSYIYRETLQPLVQKFLNEKEVSVRVFDDRLHRGEARSEYSEHGAFQSLWGHWGEETDLYYERLRVGLKLAKKKLMSTEGLPRIVGDSGIPWESVSSVFFWLFEVYLPQLLFTAAVSLHVVNSHPLSLIISPDVNDPRTRVFCLAGRLVGIKTLELQFGFYGPNNVEWRYFIADHLAVTGLTNYNVMRDHGIPDSKMTITGSPRHDGSLSWPSELVGEVRTELGVPADKKMLLFASQPYYYGAFGSADVRLAMMRSLFDASAQLRDYVLVVKPHPLEDIKDLKSFSQADKNVVFADKSLDIRDLIKAADAFVTYFSATTFDALVMNKPCLNLSFPEGCANTLFEDSGATLVARDPQQVLEALKRIEKAPGAVLTELDSARRVFLEDWFYRLDGRSTDRVGELARSMMKNEFQS
jgi:hypothetical protein